MMSSATSLDLTAGLVLGTRNAGKLKELAALLAPLGIRCQSLEGFPAAVEVEESGTTFAENAALKATEQALALGLPVLAEDSGLVVDALGGRPGVYSARFAGPAADDEANNRLLLEELADVPSRKRTAHYACHMALATPDGTVVATSCGECHGWIAKQPSGGGGFGYDPLFIVPEYHRSFGEIAGEVKGMISHRGRALRQMVASLRPRR
jgi:XTP/dITP diphosphohydrolase